MKTRIITTSFIVFALFLSSIPPVFAALRAEPVSRSPYNQRDLYSTDVFTGSANYTYPFSVPKGTNDLTPDVSLSYNSAGAKDLLQQYGAGWQLSHDYIERDVNFTPTNLSDDKFKLHFKGGVYDLIYVASENRYHTKTESYLNIQKFADGQNDQTIYWMIITQDGTKYRFGYFSQSELLCNNRSYISSWNLDFVEDSHGNNIDYLYYENWGLLYLARIQYNKEKTRVIDFIYSDNPYRHQKFIQGCNIQEMSRLSGINVKVNGNLIRQYDINYQVNNGPTQLLESITEKGSDGVALPPTTFTYKPEVYPSSMRL
jgi:hypothetical protein